MTGRAKSHRPGDRVDGRAGFGQQRHRVVHAPPDHEPVGGNPGTRLEKPREVERTHVHRPAQLGERQRSVDVGIDVGNDPPEPRPGQPACPNSRQPVRRREPGSRAVGVRSTDTPQLAMTLTRATGNPKTVLTSAGGATHIP